MALLLLFIVSIGYASAYYYCPRDQCVECTNCPYDTSRFDTLEECKQKCPLAPTCYLCYNHTCTPGYGLGCYGSPDSVVKAKTLPLCQAACTAAGASADNQRPIVPAPGVLNQQLCSNVACNFEQKTLCAYGVGNSTNGFTANKHFLIYEAPKANAALRNGIADASTLFAGVNLYPNDTAILVSSTILVQATKTLSFYRYKAGQGIQLKVCFNSLSNCPMTSITSTDTNEKRWVQNTVVMDATVRRVFFVAQNLGSSVGGVGIDDVTVYGIQNLTGQNIC